MTFSVFQPPGSERFLFEGQLTVGEEPPLPQWLQRQRALINSMREQVLLERDSAEQGELAYSVHKRLEEIAVLCYWCCSS